MTRSEFFMLRRNDVIQSKDHYEVDTFNLWRVKAKASFNTGVNMNIIAITHFLFTAQSSVLSEDNLNDYDLTPYLKRKYKA